MYGMYLLRAFLSFQWCAVAVFGNWKHLLHLKHMQNMQCFA